MSSVRNRLRRDEGFTLVEVLVAITLLGVVAAAILPMLLLGARASTVVRFETLAKNLVQERLEQMRQLPFQVDRQNGPFIDLLDFYYPGRTSAASTTSTGWVSSTSAARVAGEPSTGSFHRVVVPQVPGYERFAQVITAQFLRSDRSPVPDADFATYNSQTAGVDGPPSSYLGVHVITTWQVAGTAKRSAAYTELSNPGTATELITTQAQATAVRLQSTAPDQTLLSLVAGRVSSDGRLSDGSTASVRAVGAEATRDGTSPLRGAYIDASKPGTTSGTTDVAHRQAGSTSCGYAGFGRSANTGITPIVDGGLPRLPSSVGTSATAPADQARAALLTNSGGSCGTLSFDNLSTAYDSRLQLLTGLPLVHMPDVSSGGSPAVEGTAWLNASATTASPRFVTAGASARTVGRLSLLPVAFAADGAGLLGVQLISSNITCTATGTPVTAGYRVVVDVYRSITVNGVTTKGRGTLVDASWSSTSATAPPTIDRSLVVYDDGAGTVLRLSDYFSDFVFASAVATAPTSRAASVDAAFRLATQPVRGALAPESGVELRLGSLGCTAVDVR